MNEPYINLGFGTFVYGDCVDVLPQLPNEFINLILCDLPYGTTACKWDAIIPFDILWKEYNRLCKSDSPVVLFGKQPFTSTLIQSNLKQFKYSWIWEKSHAANFIQAKRIPLAKHEDIAVFCKTSARYFPQKTKGPIVLKRSGKQVYRERNKETILTNRPANLENVYSDEYYPVSILPFNGVAMNKRIHPTEKPVELLEYLIKTYTEENDWILDNAAGSGTTAIACENLKRRWICIEKDFDIAKKAVERIQDHIKNNA